VSCSIDVCLVGKAVETNWITTPIRHISHEMTHTPYQGIDPFELESQLAITVLLRTVGFPPPNIRGEPTFPKHI
jgi:hypothetical protein